MKTQIHNVGRRLKGIGLVLAILQMTACTLPHNVDVTLPEELPETKTTTFSQAMREMGLMSQIYGKKKLHVMAKDIIDNTGSSIPTQAEIPRDITEMVKSTLNGFGGNIVYIPYDPEFIINSANTGYSGFKTKLMPQIVVSGGITEFDRGLETRGKNTDLGFDDEIAGREVGLEYSTQDKASTASITLDFNLIDFNTLAGVPRMQAINNLKVYKALREDSLAFSIKGASIGLKGDIKKIQGRHAAVRLLVQLSMIQVVGKYMNLPYWKLLPDVPADEDVLDRVTQAFYALDERARILAVQEYLVLNDYSVSLTGRVDEETRQALEDFCRDRDELDPSVNTQTYLALYTEVPVSYETLYKRRLLAGSIEQKNHAYSRVSDDGQLRVSTNSDSYRVGEEVNISFEVSAPLYVRVLNISSNGEVAQLFPGEGKVDVLLRPGTNYDVPPADASYSLRVSGPAGQDRILAVASAKPFSRDLDLIDPNGQFSERVIKELPTRVDMAVDILPGQQARATAR